MGLFGKKKKPEVINRKDQIKLNTDNGGGFLVAGDDTDNLANNHFQWIEFYHVPTGHSVAFKAFISNFQDVFKSDWKPENVYGRMDPIATFQRTQRKISAMISVPSVSIQEAEQNMRRITGMMQMLYPIYDGAGKVPTIAGGPLFKVKFMNWIQSTDAGSGQFIGGSAHQAGLLGYLDGLTFSPNLDAGVFQYGLDIYPQEFSFTFNLNVIHEHPLGFSPGKNEVLATGESLKDGATSRAPNFPYGKEMGTDILGIQKPKDEGQKEKLKELQLRTAKIMLG